MPEEPTTAEPLLETPEKMKMTAAWVDSVSALHNGGYESPGGSSTATSVSEPSSARLQQKVKELEQEVAALRPAPPPPMGGSSPCTRVPHAGPRLISDLFRQLAEEIQQRDTGVIQWEGERKVRPTGSRCSSRRRRFVAVRRAARTDTPAGFRWVWWVQEWEEERQEMMEEMAAEARERHRLLEVSNAERVKHKEERVKMLEQIESLMYTVNESENRIAQLERAGEKAKAAAAAEVRRPPSARAPLFPALPAPPLPAESPTPFRPRTAPAQISLDPAQLKEDGNRLHKAGNYRAAVVACAFLSLPFVAVPRRKPPPFCWLTQERRCARRHQGAGIRRGQLHAVEQPECVTPLAAAA